MPSSIWLWIYWQPAAFQSVLAASAALRCAASTPSKNQSPALAAPLCAPVEQPWFPPSAVSPSLGKHCQAHGGIPSASGATDSGSLQKRGRPLRPTFRSPAAEPQPFLHLL